MWPPVETEWLPLRWHFFEREASDLLTSLAWIYFKASPQVISSDASFKDFCINASIPDSAVKLRASRSNIDIGSFGERRHDSTTFHIWNQKEPSRILVTSPDLVWRESPKQIRQLVHSVRWRRRDPPTQLPPAATYEMANTITTGLSIEHSQTLANSVGLDLGGKSPGFQAMLSHRLEHQFGLKLNITEATEITRKLTLDNSSDDCYRIFALWQVDHLLAVNVLELPIEIDVLEDIPADTELQCKFDNLQWRLCDQVQFTVANEPFITCADLRRSRTCI